MKILIGYPPTESEKGVALLSQNRQFQWFSNPSYIFPVVLGSAATMLKESGHEIIWIDCVAEKVNKNNFLKIIQKEKPDIFAFETKTPVIKKHWKLIDELKNKFPEMKIIIMGDHVTALPKETMQNSKVDFVLCGGDFDFMLDELCEYLEGKLKKMPKGFYYRSKNQIISSGIFQLKHNLDNAPLIDRELTKWELYKKEYNISRKPYFYIMSGRDCWWGKCKFCLKPSTKILTENGNIPIKDIVSQKYGENFKVLTHKGNFNPITKTFKRHYEGDMIEIEAYALKDRLSLTPNHKVFVMRDSKLEFIKAEELKKGDFIAIPKIKKVKDIKQIDINEFLEKNPVEIGTIRKKPFNFISKIISKYEEGKSQRKISKELKIDRETVKRYLNLNLNQELEKKINPLITNENNNLLKFKGAKYYFPKKIYLKKDFLRLVGYYLAEGHVFKLKNRPNSYVTGLTFSNKEKEYVDDVVSICNNFFKGIKINICHNKFNNTIQITMHNSILGILFKTLFGKNCYNKKLPNEFLYLPLDKQKELLKGLFREDGHLRVRKKGQGGSEYIFETVSEKLAQQMILILLRNNSIPRFRTIYPKKNNESIKYSISLNQMDIGNIFPEIILPKRKHNNMMGKDLGDYILVRIKNIKKNEYKGYVYNLEVEKDHSYMANNLTVSNCSWPTLFPKFRVKSVKNVLDEIGMLIEKYGAKEIFDDSGTLMTGKWLKDLCEGLIKRGYNKKIKYSCNMRFGALKQEEYDLMKKAGFRLLKFGLESANQKTLDRLNKGVKINDILEGCKMAHKAGLTVHLTMIVGYPWETKQDAMNTFKLAKELMQSGKTDLLQATVLVPYPGTGLWEEAKKNNWFLFDYSDYERYDMRESVLKTKDSNPKDVASICGKIYTIFLTPRYLFARLKNIKDIDDIKLNLRGIFAVFGHLKDFLIKK